MGVRVISFVHAILNAQERSARTSSEKARQRLLNMTTIDIGTVRIFSDLLLSGGIKG